MLLKVCKIDLLTDLSFRRGVVTDDERLQIEYDSKYSAQQAPMLVQPLSSNKFGVPAAGASIVSDINKPYSNTEVDFVLILYPKSLTNKRFLISDGFLTQQHRRVSTTKLRQSTEQR